MCGETGLLQSFPADGLKVRWRVPVGWRFSSPVVALGRVYLADSEVVKPNAKERLHCFDETTGTTLWTYADGWPGPCRPGIYRRAIEDGVGAEDVVVVLWSS